MAWDFGSGCNSYALSHVAEPTKRAGGVDGQKPPTPDRQGLGVRGSAGLDRLRPLVARVLPTDSAGPLSHGMLGITKEGNL